MLVWGTANPEGLCNEYNGFSFRCGDADIPEAVCEVVGKPVLIEHQGPGVGRVASRWQVLFVLSSNGAVDGGEEVVGKVSAQVVLAEAVQLCPSCTEQDLSLWGEA
eukprot:3268158-Rhodomonas_salina.3